MFSESNGTKLEINNSNTTGETPHIYKVNNKPLNKPLVKEEI